MGRYFKIVFFPGLLLFTCICYSQPAGMPRRLIDFKVSSGQNIIKEAHYFNFTSRSSVGSLLTNFGVKNIIAPPYFAYPFSAGLFLFDKPVPVDAYSWYPSETIFTGEINRGIQPVLNIVPLNDERGVLVLLELNNITDVNISIPIRWQMSIAFGKSTLWEWSPKAALKASGQPATSTVHHNSVSYANDSAALWMNCFGADFIYKDSSFQSTVLLAAGQQLKMGFVIVLGNDQQKIRQTADKIATAPALAQKSVRNYWNNLIESWQGKLPQLTGASPALQAFYQKGILTALSCRWQVDEFLFNPWYATSGIDGGALNCYLWDISYVAQLMALTDAASLRKHILAFTKAGINNHYAVNPADGKGMGPLYAYNFYNLVRLVYDYMLWSGDAGILDESVNGQSLQEYLYHFCLSNENLSAAPELINYGNNHNLLELKVTADYQYYTPSPNAERLLIYDMLTKIYGWKNKPLPNDLNARGELLKATFVKELWDADKQWLFTLDEQRRTHTAYSVQIFDVLRTGILDKDKETKILTHLNEREFLSKYGIHSLSKKDEGYDPNDADWGGPGVYAGDAPELINDLLQVGFDQQAIDVLKRILWWGEMPYYPQAILAAKKGYRENGRSNIIAGLGATQVVITGLFGISIKKDQLIVKPSTDPFVSGLGLKGLCIRGTKIDLAINKDGTGFSVKEMNGKTYRFKKGGTCIIKLRNL